MKSDMAVYLGLSHFVDETAEQTSMLPAFQLATPEQGQGWLTRLLRKQHLADRRNYQLRLLKVDMVTAMLGHDQLAFARH